MVATISVNGTVRATANSHASRGMATLFAPRPAQRLSNALVITAGSLMNREEIQRWVFKLLLPEDLGGTDLYSIETDYVRHVQPGKRLRVCLDPATRELLLSGAALPAAIARVHIRGALGGITANGATSALAVCEGIHQVAEETLTKQLDRITEDLLNNGRAGAEDLSMYLDLSVASNTGRGSLIPVAMAASRIRDRWVRSGRTATLTGIVLLPDRVDGGGALMRDRFQAQAYASMLELRAAEAWARRSGDKPEYLLGGRPVRPDGRIFDFIVPLSSRRLLPLQLGRRAGTLTGLLVTDAVGVGNEFRTSRDRQVQAHEDPRIAKLTGIGYGGVFLDHEQALERACICIADELFERVCAPTNDDFSSALFGGDVEGWYAGLARECLHLPAIEPEPVSGVAPSESQYALEQMHEQLDQLIGADGIADAGQGALAAAAREALDVALRVYLTSGQPLGGFGTGFGDALAQLDQVASTWANEPPPNLPILVGDVAALNQSLVDYAEQLNDHAWHVVAGVALWDMVHIYYAFLGRNVDAVVATLSDQLREDAPSNHLRARHFLDEVARTQIPGLADLWCAGGAFERFYEAHHPFRKPAAGSGMLEDVPDLLAQLLEPVREQLVQGFHEGDADVVWEAYREAARTYFRPRIGKTGISHFVDTYVRDDAWFEARLQEAVALAEPLVELRPSTRTREPNVYVEVPAPVPGRGDIRPEALFKRVARLIDSKVVSPEMVMADRPLPCIIVFKTYPNLQFEDLQMFEPGGEYEEAFSRYFDAWRRDRAFPLFTDAQLQALVATELPEGALLADPLSRVGGRTPGVDPGAGDQDGNGKPQPPPPPAGPRGTVRAHRGQATVRLLNRLRRRPGRGGARVRVAPGRDAS